MRQPNQFPDGTRVMWARNSKRRVGETFGTVLRQVGSHQNWRVQWDSGRVSGVWAEDITRDIPSVFDAEERHRDNDSYTGDT